MTIRLCNQGEVAWLDLITSVDYQVRLFTNDVESGLTDTQINALDETDFTEATFTGYAPATITAAGWSAGSEADPSSKAYASAVSFIRTSTGTGEDVYGWYLTLAADDSLVLHEYFASPVTIDTVGEQINVTIPVTLADTGDS